MRKLLERLRIWAIRKLGGYAKTDVPTIQYVHSEPLCLEARAIVGNDDPLYGFVPPEQAAPGVLIGLLAPKIAREMAEQNLITIRWERIPGLDATMFRASVLACREEGL